MRSHRWFAAAIACFSLAGGSIYFFENIIATLTLIATGLGMFIFGGILSIGEQSQRKR